MEQNINDNINIGKRLKELRTDAGLSQERVCVALQLRGCDIGRSTYSKYESGELKIKPAVLKALAKIYNRPLEELFSDMD